MLSFHTYVHLRNLRVWNVNSVSNAASWYALSANWWCMRCDLGRLHPCSIADNLAQSGSSLKKNKSYFGQTIFLWRCTIFVESNETSFGKNGALLGPPGGYRKQFTFVYNFHKCEYFTQKQVGRICICSILCRSYSLVLCTRCCNVLCALQRIKLRASRI